VHDLDVFRNFLRLCEQVGCRDKYVKNRQFNMAIGKVGKWNSC